MNIQFDILGVGNAIMDVIAPLSEQALGDLNIAKGVMTLIDQDRALDLHKGFKRHSGDMREIAGGSAANTLVGITTLGVKGAYIGTVAKDKLGERYKSDFQAAGVYYDVNFRSGNIATGRSLIAVTPDGERSMNTFLGASAAFDDRDIDPKLIQNSGVIYLEGYLFDKPAAKQAFIKAAQIAKQAGRGVALTLSDAFCVNRHRESFRNLVRDYVDIIFANEAELLSLYEVDEFDAAMPQIGEDAKTACVTRSEKGSVISADGEYYDIPAAPISRIVDTTGAGDQYAAGVLAGRAMGLSWGDAGYLGSQCAAEVISHYGARPERSIL